MKNMKKLFSLLLALVMVLGLATTAFAQDEEADAEGKGTITISNPAMGETYSVVKLFDASVTGTAGGSIIYSGTVPDTLTSYFTTDNYGNISATDAADFDDENFVKALVGWAKDQVATASAESEDGTALTFSKLPYGYYVVLSSQGAAVTVTSTNPNVTVTDKNTTIPSDLTKAVDDQNVKIGDTATYTVTFNTANYNKSKKIVSYTIEDDLPEFLSSVNVTKIVVDNDADTTTTDDQIDVTKQFDDNKTITIDWVDDDENFLYDNGAKVIITYTAVVTEKAAVAGAGNTNTVTLSWDDEDGDVTPPNPDAYKKTATIYTYALALKKVDDKGNALAGATFELPFYVNETPDAKDGAYIYAGTTDGEGLTKTLTSPEDGIIIVKGLEYGTPVEIAESNAPAGYNKLDSNVTVTPMQTDATTTNENFYIDTDGNVTLTGSTTTVTVTVKIDNIAATPIVVVNKSGTELPSTGGMGTTMIYTIGGILVVAAVVLLVTKKRMAR